VTDHLDLSELAPMRVSYPSAGRELAGYLFRPAGAGPFPAMLVNHGSGGLGPRLGRVAGEVNRFGYAAFLPVRRGYNENPGPHWRSHLTADEWSEAWGRQMVDALSQENDDVLAALAWLREQPGIDPTRIGIMGISFGGIMTTLAVSRVDDFRAAVNFAGAAMNWERNVPVREMMLEAIRRVETPIFLIQAVNDFSLGPTYGLGAELARLGKPHEARIYGPSGTTPQEGHGFFTSGVETWSPDVRRFLASWL
jgi:carboxymethylenebutenolidase